MGSRPRAQSPSSVNKTSQWQLAWVFRRRAKRRKKERRAKRRARANAKQFFAEEPRLCAPAIQRWYSNYDDGTSEWLTNGIPWKTPQLLTPSSALQKPASPPTPIGMEDRTGLRQRWQPLLFRSVGRITPGKRTPCRGTLRSHILHKEVPCGDYAFGLAKGSTTYGSLWGRLSPPGHSREGRRFLPGKDTGSPWGEPYRGRIHMWDHRKGNHYTWAPSPAQGLTLGNTRVLDLESGAPPRLTAEGAGGTTTGFAVGNWTEKQQGARIRSVEGNGAASVIDTEHVPVLPAIRDKYTGGHWLYTEIIKSRKRIRCRPASSFTNVCYRGAPRQAQEEATPLVKCALTPRGHGKHRAW